MVVEAYDPVIYGRCERDVRSCQPTGLLTLTLLSLPGYADASFLGADDVGYAEVPGTMPDTVVYLCVRARVSESGCVCVCVRACFVSDGMG